MSLLIVILYAVLGAVTLALVQLASIVIEHERLELHEIVLTFIFWPAFLALLVIRLRSS